MKNLYLPITIAITFGLSACCGTWVEVPEFCEYQVFTETKSVPVNYIYRINTDKKFIEAHILTARQIKDALDIDGGDFKVKKIHLTSSHLAYKRGESHSAPAMFIHLAVVGNTFNQLLLTKQNQLVPLVDVPATIFTDPVNINQILNEQGVKELGKILKQYVEFLNEDGISILMVGEPSPAGAKIDVSVRLNLHFMITYEVCRLVPLGTGEGFCE